MGKQEWIDYPATNFRKLRNVVTNFALEHDLIAHYNDLEFVMDSVDEGYYRSVWKYYNNNLLIVKVSFRLNSINVYKYTYDWRRFINKEV